MEKCALNQQKLSGERERDTQIYCPYLVQAKSKCLHHIQNIWAWGALGSLPKMKKCTINQQKLPREKEETSKHDVHTLAKPSKVVSTIYSKFEHSVLKDLCQKGKNALSVKFSTVFISCLMKKQEDEPNRFKYS